MAVMITLDDTLIIVTEDDLPKVIVVEVED